MSFDLILVVGLLLVLSHILHKRLNSHLIYIKCLQDITKEHFNAIVKLHNYTMEQAQRIKNLEDYIASKQETQNEQH